MSDTVSTAVSLAPAVDLVKPYADVLVDGVLSIVGSAAAVYVLPTAKKYLGQAVVNLFEAKVEAWAAAEAHAAVAAAEDNLAKRTITVQSAIVVDAAARIEAGMPAFLKAIGWTSDRLKVLVAAEIGKLQIKMATAPAAAAPVAK